jgi:hypothetical protein
LFVNGLYDGAQEIYLRAEHLAVLKEEEGIEPWTFEQNEGEAVYIPAGCPHQVPCLCPIFVFIWLT